MSVMLGTNNAFPVRFSERPHTSRTPITRRPFTTPLGTLAQRWIGGLDGRVEQAGRRLQQQDALLRQIRAELARELENSEISDSERNRDHFSHSDSPEIAASPESTAHHESNPGSPNVNISIGNIRATNAGSFASNGRASQDTESVLQEFQDAFTPDRLRGLSQNAILNALGQRGQARRRVLARIPEDLPGTTSRTTSSRST